MVQLSSSLWKTLLALAIVYLVEEARSANPREYIEKKTIYIGGLFGEGAEKEMVAFKAATEQINMNRDLLPNVNLVPKIEYVSPPDSFTTGKRVCNLTMQGVAALFGPSSHETTGIVQSICDTMRIPHILTHWNPSSEIAPQQFNMYPDPKLLSRALVDVLDDMDWKSFTIIYENDEGLVRLQEVLKRHGPGDLPITVRQLGPGPDYRPLLKEIHNTSETHIVLDVDTDKIMNILRQAKEVKMMEDYQSYLITSLDAHTLDFGEFKHGYTNISGMRYINPQSHEVQSAVQNFMHIAKKDFPELNLEFSADTLRVSTALIYDAVYLFATSLHKVDTENAIETQSISCDQGIRQWQYGESLIEYLKIASYNGLSGEVKFNGSSYRREFMLDLMELHMLRKVGSWDPITGVNLTRTVEDIQREVGENLANKTMKIASRIGEPYLMYTNNSDQLTGNDRYEGYSKDLIDEISQILGFKYEFYIVADNKYGSVNPATGKWDGLVRELIDRKADLAICDLTITFERERAVDFTMPFMNLGISILFSRPVKQPAKLFSFLSPLSVDVWLYMATAYLGVSVLMFVLARMTPYEWDNPHPCNPDPDELENTFTLLNSLWFAIGSLMQQGCDFLPKAVSTRIVAGMWWFFTLIMISSYTANLAAFLTVDRMDASIESAEDLAKQTKIKYGSVDGGSTKSFFQNSNFSTYQRMWATMDSTRPSVFMKNNKDGVDRVLKGKGTYAFLMESTSIEYEVNRHCELQQVGNLLDSKGYGIAMPVNSPYRTAISGAVLKLQEEGKLSILKQNWWKRKDGEECETQGAATDISANELGLANVGGVFVVLILGCGVAFLVSVLEFLWNSRKVAVEEKITPTEALRQELRFAIRCRGTTKPVQRKSSQTPDSNVSRSLMRLNVFQKLDNNDK